jgi:hypothetical protein
LTVFQFRDSRGGEGDADPYRVGGTYGGYGNRLAKVMSEAPWQRTLQRALAEAFQTRGVAVTVLEDREYATGGPFATPMALAGDIRNFSTESRWSMASHVSAIIRLYDSGGRRLVEKTISARGGGGLGAGVFANGDAMQDMMNQALAAFVHKVVTDPEILAQLQGLAQ